MGEFPTDIEVQRFLPAIVAWPALAWPGLAWPAHQKGSALVLDCSLTVVGRGRELARVLYHSIVEMGDFRERGRLAVAHCR